LINTIIIIFKVVFLLGVLIIIHETAHFAVAKWCKIKVKEFSIGFGPCLLNKKGKETQYTLRLIPLGGYVSMLGEDQREDAEGSFSNASVLKRIAVVAAGGLMNILFGLLVYFILVANISDIGYAFDATKNFLWALLDSLKSLFTGGISIDQFMGPIGISDLVSETTKLNDFIYLLAVVSLSLGITNLLPFPPLDGGKILLYLIEAIRKKPVKEQTEMSLQLLGFAVLIILSIYIAYNDILRIF